MKKPLLNKVLLAVAALLLCNSCLKDDEKTYPSLIADLVEVKTNSEKVVNQIFTDSGKVLYPVQTLTAAVADTTYRCYCSYALKEGTTNMAELYQLYAVPSMKPVAADKFPNLRHDPVVVNSVWNSDKYINVSYSIRTSGASKHAIAFCEDSIVDRVAYVSLHHEQPLGDLEAYSQSDYLSLPAYVYASDCDSVAFTINTYMGAKTYGKRL